YLLQAGDLLVQAAHAVQSFVERRKLVANLQPEFQLRTHCILVKGETRVRFYLDALGLSLAVYRDRNFVAARQHVGAGAGVEGEIFFITLYGWQEVETLGRIVAQVPVRAVDARL